MRKVTIIIAAAMSILLIGCSNTEKKSSNQTQKKETEQVQIAKDGTTQKPSSTSNSNQTPSSNAAPGGATTQGSTSTPSTTTTPPASTNPSGVTKEKAVELVKEFMKSKGSYMPSIIEVDNEDSEKYTIHAYDIVENHTATTGWYTVNKATGKVESMF